MINLLNYFVFTYIIFCIYETCNAAVYQVSLQNTGSLLENIVFLDGKFGGKSGQDYFGHRFPGKSMKEELRKYQNEFYSNVFVAKSAGSISLIDFYGSFLTGNVSLGTPAQILQVAFDLGSADIWVVDSECTTLSCTANATVYQRKQFNKTASSTYSNQSSKFGAYIGGVAVNGIWAKDYFNISGLRNSSVSFGLVDNSDDAFKNIPVDGVVGLGWPTLSSQNNNAALEAIFKQLDSPVFSLFIERKANLSQPTTNGVVTFGKQDEANCVSTWNTVPVSVDDYWQFVMSGFKVGNLKSRTSQEAILYSLSPFLIGPHKYVEWIVNATKAKYVDTYGLYSVNCSSQTLPDIVFTMGEKDFALPPNNYLIQIGSNQSQCLLLLVASNMESLGFNWVLGAPFLRSFCTLYNFSGNGTIGFSNTKY